MQEVKIVGAGLSGMTAAVVLAREGYKVTVFDAGQNVGGSPDFHPSVHTTPAQLPQLWDYVGLNLEDDFVKCNPYPMFYYNKRFLKLPPYIKHNTAYCIERGARPTSIDNHLFAMAQEAGVRFEFGRKLDLEKLGSKTIVATGLYPEGYKKMGISHRRIYVTWSKGEMADQTSSTGVIYLGDYVTPDYAYTAEVHGLDYALMFAHSPITKKNKGAFKNALESRGKGNYAEPWRDVVLAVPAEANLFWKDAILAGTLSGMIEPFWGYGIVGAIISGRIAAKAIMDREEAVKDFEFFTRNFDKKFKRRETLSSYSPFASGILIRAGITWARLQCLWQRDLASRTREPLRWFRE
ncbi:MAG: FAD-binding protein [Syntrophobacterales bacterium]|nr:MAG: FAD-binding protein [Syntrophobacterales bacterium]